LQIPAIASPVRSSTSPSAGVSVSSSSSPGRNGSAVRGGDGRVGSRPAGGSRHPGRGARRPGPVLPRRRGARAVPGQRWPANASPLALQPRRPAALSAP
jgi:hypothetical protein